jgi:hypothetical protein
MEWIHRWLEMGEMPAAPIVEYLARSLSAFYALLGALLLLMASDIERYRLVVRFLAVTGVLMKAAFTWVDYAAGMPWWWTASEGPTGIAMWALVYSLARPDRRAESDTR